MNNNIIYKKNFISKLLNKKKTQNSIEGLFNRGDLIILDAPLLIKEISPVAKFKKSLDPDIVTNAACLVNYNSHTRNVISTTILIKDETDFIHEYGHYIDSNYTHKYFGLSHSVQFDDIVSGYRSILKKSYKNKLNNNLYNYSILEEEVFASAYEFYFFYFVAKMSSKKLYDVLSNNSAIFLNDENLKLDTINFFNHLT